MSIYNMMFGHNSNSALVVSAFVGYDITNIIPRYRDTFLDIDEKTGLPTEKFEIYTRMGGGNYDCWKEDETDYSSQETILKHEETCDCPYHKLKKIEKESWYVDAEDDDFDSTYRTLNGKFTPEFLEKLQKCFVCNSFAPLYDEIKKVFPELCETNVGDTEEV